MKKDLFVGLLINLVVIILLSYLPAPWEARAIFFLIFIDLLIIGGRIIFWEDDFSYKVVRRSMTFFRYLSLVVLAASITGTFLDFPGFLEAILAWPGIIASIILFILSLFGVELRNDPSPYAAH